MKAKKDTARVPHPVAPADMKKMLASSPKAKAIWDEITPLARNEWICWITSAKMEGTRKIRIEKGRSKMESGMRRPCCWMGCPHRTDKGLSPAQKFVLGRRSKK